MVFGFPVLARRPYAWARAALCASVLVSMGCTPGGSINIITGMSFSGRSQRPNSSCGGSPFERRNCTPELEESLRFAKIGEQVSVDVQGTGRCRSIAVDFGDGVTVSQQNVEFVPNALVRFVHTYTGWPGKKQVRVKGIGTSCLGEFTKELSVGIDANGHEEFRLAFLPNTMVCTLVGYVGGPGIPLRAGTVFSIAAKGLIRYGPLGVMEFNASGDTFTGNQTPATYPFPNHRIYSVIYRAPGRDVQGENGTVVFTAGAPGFLSICANDDARDLADNTGGMLLEIRVNESAATP